MRPESDSAKVAGSLFLGSIFLLVVGAATLPRLFLQLEGVIVTSVDEPYRVAPRYGTHYQLRTPDGRAVDYMAGTTDASLDRSIAAGSRIQKKRGELGYTVNGRWRDFPKKGYAIMLTISLFCFGRAGFFGLRKFTYPRP